MKIHYVWGAVQAICHNGAGYIVCGDGMQDYLSIDAIHDDGKKQNLHMSKEERVGRWRLFKSPKRIYAMWDRPEPRWFSIDYQPLLGARLSRFQLLQMVKGPDNCVEVFSGLGSSAVSAEHIIWVRQIWPEPRVMEALGMFVSQECCSMFKSFNPDTLIIFNKQTHKMRGIHLPRYDRKIQNYCRPAISRDGLTVAVGNRAGEVYIIDLDEE